MFLFWCVSFFFSFFSGVPVSLLEAWILLFQNFVGSKKLLALELIFWRCSAENVLLPPQGVSTTTEKSGHKRQTKF